MGQEVAMVFVDGRYYGSILGFKRTRNLTVDGVGVVECDHALVARRANSSVRGRLPFDLLVAVSGCDETGRSIDVAGAPFCPLGTAHAEPLMIGDWVDIVCPD